MLLDTGAEQTVLDEALLIGWGLLYTSAGWATTMNATKPVRSYEVILKLGDPEVGCLTFDPLTVMARSDPFVGARYSGLLGRDVLDLCYFVYDGPGHTCILRF
ncbi:MAG TPA: hypothetical protein VN326_13080 [Casimicrobiaceae bacterium]|nr:hypothetical protein [Casimicrobiaceae bacterium]